MGRRRLAEHRPVAAERARRREPGRIGDRDGRPVRTCGAGVGEFQERMTRSPQTMTSPWLPTVFVGLAHSVQLTISLGLAGAETSISRKPA